MSCCNHRHLFIFVRPMPAGPCVAISTRARTKLVKGPSGNRMDAEAAHDIVAFICRFWSLCNVYDVGPKALYPLRKRFLLDCSSGEDRFRRFTCSETCLVYAGVRPFWRNFPHVLFFPYQQEGAVPSSPSSFRPGAPDCVGAFSSTWQFVSGGAVAAAAETCFERWSFVLEDVSCGAVCAQQQRRGCQGQKLPVACLLQSVIVPRMFPFRARLAGRGLEPLPVAPARSW